VVKRLGLLALLGLVSGSLLTAAVKVGDPAPAIHFDKLLPEQPAANASFEALAGKAVVLEIWATWCGPCVGAIPHLNELAEKFKDRPIVFLSVSNEEPAVVEGFLKKRPIGGLVGIAHAESPWKLYGVEGIPATFLIDATGKIAGSTHPEGLSASILEDLMAGRPLSVTLPKPFDFSVARGGDDSGPAPLLDLLVRPSSNRNSSGFRTGKNSLAVKGGKLVSILSYLYQMQQTRMTGEPLDDATIYDLSFSIPGTDPESFRSLARDLAAAAFHIKVARETRETDVWILAATDMKPAALVEPASTGGSSWNSGNGSLRMTNFDLSNLARALESAAGKPVLDETGITGKYDIRLTYDKSDPQGAIEAMRKLGFKVEPARRPIEFLAVSKAQ
jgi:uncharacterized protein (TIGR03435 family)